MAPEEYPIADLCWGGYCCKQHHDLMSMQSNTANSMPQQGSLQVMLSPRTHYSRKEHLRYLVCLLLMLLWWGHIRGSKDESLRHVSKNLTVWLLHILRAMEQSATHQ